MGLFDKFLSPAPQAPQAPVTPGNIPAPADPPAANNPTLPESQASTNSSLDAFKDIWDAAPNSDTNSPYAPKQLDPAEVQKVVSKADFSNLFSQENLTAISQGGEAAKAAFVNSLNAFGQQLLTQSTLVANTLATKEVERALNAHNAQLPEILRKQTVKENLHSANPLLNDPAIKPVVDSVQEQLARKYPNASAAEITKLTENYVVAMGEHFAPKPQKSSTGVEDFDWGKFLSAE